MSDIYFRFTSQMYSMYFRLYLTSSSELSKKKKRMYPSEGCIFARAKKPRHFFHTCFLEHIFERARVTSWTPCLICLQAIVESPTGQLKLGEIYTWFSNNFKHFRTTCNLTWKVTKSFLQKMYSVPSSFSHYSVPIFPFDCIPQNLWGLCKFLMGLVIALQVRLSFLGII